MSPDQKRKILSKAKVFFRERIALPHKANIEKLEDPAEFNINPFLQYYLAKILCGNTSHESLARALIYPRVLSTSITTTFGTQMQYFCSEVLEGFGSKIFGLDLEFVDASDGRKKYCQLKLGPNTINKDDVTTIVDKFDAIKNLARANKVKGLEISDLIVGVAYGSDDELSGHYRRIRDNHHFPVLVGKDFWHRLSGEESFYGELISTFVSVAEETDSDTLIEDVVEKLAKKLKDKI
jgi:Type II restriction endonuclease EcoO109I